MSKDAQDPFSISTSTKTQSWSEEIENWKEIVQDDDGFELCSSGITESHANLGRPKLQPFYWLNYLCGTQNLLSTYIREFV